MKKLSSYGISHIILPIVVVLSVGVIGTLIYAVSHAQTPVKTVSSTAAAIATNVKICLHVNRSLCLQAYGINGGLTTKLNSDSRWTITPAGEVGFYIKNSHGNCLSGESNFVFLEKGCKDNKFYKWLVKTGTVGVTQFQSENWTGGDMGVLPPLTNASVYTAGSGTGFYYGWNY